MPRPSQRPPRALARVRSAPWRERGAVLALVGLAALWGAVRAGLLAAATAFALAILGAVALGLGGREPGAS